MKVLKRFISVCDKRRELILLTFTSGLTSGLHVQDPQISTRGRPLWRRFAGNSSANTLQCVGQQCRSGGKFGGQRWSTDRVIFNAHLTYRKRLKLNILNAPKKALTGCRNRFRNDSKQLNLWPPLRRYPCVSRPLNFGGRCE